MFHPILARFAAMVAVACITGCSGSAATDSAARSNPGSTGLQYGPTTYSGPKVSAHRGGAAYAPEDTMAAYRNAARFLVDYLETDTWLTRDGVLALIHDNTLDRTTNCSGKVADRTFAELQQCDAGYWFAPGQSTTVQDASLPHPYRGKGITVPSAQELFAYAASFGPYGPGVTIELKDSSCNASATALVNLIHASGIQSRIIVVSFNSSCLDLVEMMDSTIQTLHLGTNSCRSQVTFNVTHGYDIIGPNLNVSDLNAQCVSEAHAVGQQVNPWTVDRAQDFQNIAAMGADAIVTNYPACMLQLQDRPLPDAATPPDYGGDPIPFCR